MKINKIAIEKHVKFLDTLIFQKNMTLDKINMNYIMNFRMNGLL